MIDNDAFSVDRSPFLLFPEDEDEDDFDEMVTRNDLLVDALGFPLTNMENYLDCLSDQSYDIDFYLDEIENILRLRGI